MFDRIKRWFGGGSSSDSPINEFLTRVRKSGLIEEPKLEHLLREFEESDKPYGDSLTSLETFLIAREALTPWQAFKLRENKYKGFLLDDFVLLDCLEVAHDCTYYLARHLPSSRRVALKIPPPRFRGEPGDPIRFEVVEL